MAGSSGAVVRVGDLESAAIRELAERYGVKVVSLPDGAAIPGSYWGEPEAGLLGNRLFLRVDTPVHSLLHELSHYVCMHPERRAALDTDAGGDDEEECAVCYLQVMLSDSLPGYGRARCLADMECWGYSFREGSASDWFVGDGQEARNWLMAQSLLDAAAQPTWQTRSGPMPEAKARAQS